MYDVKEISAKEYLKLTKEEPIITTDGFDFLKEDKTILIRRPGDYLYFENGSIIDVGYRNKEKVYKLCTGQDAKGIAEDFLVGHTEAQRRADKGNTKKDYNLFKYHKSKAEKLDSFLDKIK